MPLDASIVGAMLGVTSFRAEPRWLMSYAAGVPDERSELYDTSQELVVHPLFPVAPEWELLIAPRASLGAMSADEARRGIHLAHDLVLERTVQAGEQIHLSAQVVGVGRRPAGATQDVLLVATASDGEVVWRTAFTSLFLGVDLVGEPVSIKPGSTPPLAKAPTVSPLATRRSFVRLIDAHVYSACARIWNPIHTDVAAARRSGLEAPILHGTATLARAVSIVAELANVQLGDVCRVAGRFAAMVELGTEIEVRLLAVDDGHYMFEVWNHLGRRAIADGSVISRLGSTPTRQPAGAPPKRMKMRSVPSIRHR